ncbi:MAG TPA: ATP-binding protein [Flavobacterium sp.]|nr:ATP-binding protein [Flavobacterium sp.]
MFTRKIYPILENHLSKKQVTVITGLRRVGKSTALKYLYEKAETSNKIYLDLERIENQNIFSQNSYKDIERSLELLGFDFSQPGIIGLDEIQMAKNSSSVIKALYDDYGVKFIVTGSSSFYLKNHFSESLAGRKRIFEMYPLDFEEFLQFKEVNTKNIQKEKFKTFLPTYYDLYKTKYEEFIRFGGFPEVVLADNADDKTAYLKDILNSHIELDVKLLGDVSSSDVLYKLILLLANRVGSKMDYSKIGNLLGINRLKVKEYILLLEYTYLIKTIKPFAKGIDKEITKQSKIYFADTGLLQICGQTSSGAIFENVIAHQLSLIGELNYYEKSSGTEIDFILDKKNAIEVKETLGGFDIKSLQKRSKPLELEQNILIGRELAPSGFKDFVWGGNVF